MKQISINLLFMILVAFISCNQKQKPIKNKIDTQELDSLVTNWHKAASDANGNVFFGFMDSTAIYIGTDATERWTKQEFMTFAKPYFDKGKAWDFKTRERRFYTNDLSKNIVWFDETLDTWMGICRSSGVLLKRDEGWKIAHYHLSVAVPNEKIKGVIDIIKNAQNSENE